jgi:hypothetical protein
MGNISAGGAPSCEQYGRAATHIRVLAKLDFVFVSHATLDKPDRVKPLIQALALEGVSFWLDRPGPGENDFQFTADFIRRHGVRRLISGEDWSQAIMGALKDSSAVLVCLSKAALESDAVREEVLLAFANRKAVTCVVDDLDLQLIPNKWILIQPGRLQSPRIDINSLAAAVRWLEEDPGRSADALPESSWGRAWQSVRDLRDDLAAAARRALRGNNVPPVTQSQAVKTLQALLVQSGAPAAQVRRLYCRSLPDTNRQARGVSLVDLLNDLQDSRPRTAFWPSPLIEFAERLGRELGDSAILQWVDEQTASDPSPLTTLRSALDEETRRGAAVATLYVDVDTDGESQIRWWVEATEPRLCKGESIVPIRKGMVDSQLAACLTQALRGVDEQIGHLLRIRVALLLPITLLTGSLETLAVDFDDGDDLGLVSEPLFKRHAVALHWRARALARPNAGGRAVRTWIRALEALRSRLDGSGASKVLWLEGGAEALPAATARLLHPGEESVCLGLGPQPADREDIAACLREGVPCFLWFGTAAKDSHTRHAHVGQQFALLKPREAAAYVGQLRMISRDGEPFASLSVVWDDGTSPAPTLFSSPARSPTT